MVIKGGIHAFFGDYGEQPGDGTPTIDRARTPRRRSSRRPIALMASLTADAEDALSDRLTGSDRRSLARDTAVP